MPKVLPAPRRRSRSAALLLVLTLALTACGGPDEDSLAEAVEATLDDGFGYRLAVEADPDAVAAIGDAGGLLSVIAGLELSGRVTDGEGSELIVSAAGQPVIEIVVLEDALYFRGALQDLFGVLGAGAFDPRDEMLPALQTLGVSDAMLAATLEAFDGNWIGILGELDRDRFAAALGQPVDETTTEADTAARELLGGDLPELVERFVAVEDARDTDEGTRYDVAVDLDALLAALVDLNTRLGTDGTVDADALREDLASFPDTVPGEAVTLDGELRRFETTLVGADAEGAGALRVVAEFEPEIEPPVAPSDPTIVSAEEFLDALERITDITGLGG